MTQSYIATWFKEIKKQISSSRHISLPKKSSLILQLFSAIVQHKVTKAMGKSKFSRYVIGKQHNSSLAIQIVYSNDNAELWFFITWISYSISFIFKFILCCACACACAEFRGEFGRPILLQICLHIFPHQSECYSILLWRRENKFAHI